MDAERAIKHLEYIKEKMVGYGENVESDYMVTLDGIITILGNYKNLINNLARTQKVMKNERLN